MLARIAIKQVDLRAKPNDEASIVGNRFRDQLIHLYEEVRPLEAPKYFNNLWYRVWGGFIHSAHLQLVNVTMQEPTLSVPESGMLCEVTVPFTTAYQHNDRDGWYLWRGSRLYYETTHWATAVETGPDGEPWYQITSELSKSEKYYAPARHLRPIPPEEYAPIATDIPADKKRIEVSLAEQKLPRLRERPGSPGDQNLIRHTQLPPGAWRAAYRHSKRLIPDLRQAASQAYGQHHWQSRCRRIWRLFSTWRSLDYASSPAPVAMHFTEHTGIITSAYR